jgi:exonuclease III
MRFYCVLLCIALLSCRDSNEQENKLDEPGSNIASDEKEIEKDEIKTDLGLENKDKHLFVFYNVENLFDTEDDPLTSDEEFTPFGEKEWTEERYRKKLKDVASALAAISPSTLPSFIGLAEVENYQVVKELSKTGKLTGSNYKIVHAESPDNRGIDNALLYDPNYFKESAHEFIRVNFPWNTDIKTRDILHCWGLNAMGEEVHIYVNHWPSRRDGEKETEKKRLRTAEELKKSIAKVQNTNLNAKIIVMGDFNDLPDNKSIEEVIQSKTAREKGVLVNLSSSEFKKGKGSIVHEREWLMIDQMMVSPNLLEQRQKGWYLHKKQNSAKSFYKDMLLYTARDGNKMPNKTYGGDRYYGGYSDHLPVYFWLYEK